MWCELSAVNQYKEPDMKSTTIAIDIAKDVFQLAIADDKLRVVESVRLNRKQFLPWFENREVHQIVMEACGSAHHWARCFQSRGIQVVLLPAAYIRAYVQRSKTDAADAAALIEALRGGAIKPVQTKSLEQQALQGLHRIRSLWMHDRTARINTLRGLLREFGIPILVGARTGIDNIGRVLADPASTVPTLIRESLKVLLDEIRMIEAKVTQIERQLSEAARQSTACKLLLSIPGIGLLTATAMVAATSGSVAHFKSARHFALWVGLTPCEFSSGNNRFMGRISKKGDRYLRMLLTHGARSLMRSNTVCVSKAKELKPGLHTWANQLQHRTHHNKAACAVANKMARVCYAVLRDGEPFDQPSPRPNKKTV
jgi:transposase